jgi:hypothetical protein
MNFNPLKEFISLIGWWLSIAKSSTTNQGKFQKRSGQIVERCFYRLFSFIGRKFLISAN